MGRLLVFIMTSASLQVPILAFNTFIILTHTRSTTADPLLPAEATAVIPALLTVAQIRCRSEKNSVTHLASFLES